ncbi:S49 family peptidase [Enhydrobacter sp.]|jgi:protease-4|uniref:S49 family peptidase n=1 Tax=Enhydrobacter sp. TaxID=1894999 RepID=UPI0026296E4A|nr:S49 family peptidase [Enhydrobacter sp.]WIM13059.1 MAG: Signal peptide peptidase SppA (protease 4) [Enhydrobacter sp.]
MRRFIIGLLATIGAITLLGIGAMVLLFVRGPLAVKPLPDSMVLSLDLRRLPPETVSSGVLGGLWSDSRDMVDTLQALWHAADDPHVAGLYVEIGDEDAGLARVQELREAIQRFRSKGKFAIGFAESLGSDSDHFADYYLAAALDRIWLQPSGGFGVAGLAIETPFLKGGLDKLGIRVEGGKRYEYKSAPDTFTQADMTAPARENLQQLIDGLYGRFIEDVSRDRRIPPAKLRQLIDSAPLDSERARTEGLVDKIGYRADAMDDVWQHAGSTRDLVTLSDYANGQDRPDVPRDVVALVRVSGTIVSGTNANDPLGDDLRAASDDIVDALDSAAQSKEVKAIVLRIDSPGGTYPAADAVADGVGRARSAGKPVIASMGDVAASGGYLAAVRANAIVAEPTTITGSIGVFGIWPVATDLLATLGIKVDRLRVGANAGMYSPFHVPTPAQQVAIGRELDSVYADFTRQVADARGLDAARLDAAARGRVFTGIEAKRAGLIDELGGLDVALRTAKAKAGIDASKPIELRPFPAESNTLQRIATRLMRLADVTAKGPKVHVPRELRDLLAKFGIAARPGNVRLPPLPPLWH